MRVPAESTRRVCIHFAIGTTLPVQRPPCGTDNARRCPKNWRNGSRCQRRGTETTRDGRFDLGEGTGSDVPLTSFTSTAFGRCRSHYINVTGNAFAALFRSLGKRVVYDIIEIGRCQDCGQSSLKAPLWGGCGPLEAGSCAILSMSAASKIDGFIPSARNTAIPVLVTAGRLMPSEGSRPCCQISPISSGSQFISWSSDILPFLPPKSLDSGTSDPPESPPSLRKPA
jgi:hypothetical protein